MAIIQPSPFQSLLNLYTQQAEAAKAANISRYNEAKAIYDEIISRYRPGGSFQQAGLQQIETQKKRDVAMGEQRLVSSGLFGSTVTGGLGKKYEEEVGGPARLKLEDLMMERLGQAQMSKAGLIERREDTYPDLGSYMQMANQMGRYSGGVTRNINWPDSGGGSSGDEFIGAKPTPPAPVRGQSNYTPGGSLGAHTELTDTDKAIVKRSGQPMSFYEWARPQLLKGITAGSAEDKALRSKYMAYKAEFGA